MVIISFMQNVLYSSNNYASSNCFDFEDPYYNDLHQNGEILA